MKNLERKEGFLNRHTDGLPKESCNINVVISKDDGDKLYNCNWKPYDKNDYPENGQPFKGFLGTAVINGSAYSGVGFNAWEQHDFEFIFYSHV